jgi:preprotein translocase subunit SecE
MSTAQAAKLNSTSEPNQRGVQAAGRQTPEWLEGLLGYPRRARKFLQEVRAEMKLVVWPSRQDVRSTTLVVILTTAIFAVFLWLVERGSIWAVAQVLKAFKH